jgi:hypothetical protein
MHGITFAAMLEAYEACFIMQAGSELAESKFNAARQMPDKTILMFHARVRELFNTAYPMEPYGCQQSHQTSPKELHLWPGEQPGHHICMGPQAGHIC